MHYTKNYIAYYVYTKTCILNFNQDIKKLKLT